MAKKIEGIHDTPIQEGEENKKVTKKTFKKYYFTEINKTIEAENRKEATKKAQSEAKK